MRVAITGISGYLGRLVAEHLARDPAVEWILGMDRVAPGSLPPKARFTAADVLGADFERLLQGIDAVVHLAFIVAPPRGVPMADIDAINVEGSRRVFEGAIAAGASRIVYASSIAAYGSHPDNPQPLTEDHPLRPNPGWYYSRNKGPVEDLLDGIEARNPELTVIRLRPSVFLGPTINNPFGSLFDRRFLISLDQSQRLDLCWDDDVAAAFRLALHYPESDCFNLSGERPFDMERAGELLGRSVIRLAPWCVRPLVRLATRLGLLSPGVMEWVEASERGPINASAGRARSRLGWQPSFDSEGTLMEYVRGRGEGGSRRRGKDRMRA
jgi:UDP-glucose 4-epimerase